MNIKTILITFTILVCNNTGVFSKEFNLKDYLKTRETDATLAVLEMLGDAAGFDNSTISIEEGEYHFYPEKAFEKYCSVSNHDNSLRRIAFPLIGYKGLKIAGKNARLIFHGLMMPFNIEDCQNIRISGISIDWQIPLHSEATIEANNPEEGNFDLRISEEYPYVVRDNNLFFIKEGYEHDLGASILFDPERKAVAFNNNNYMPLQLLSNTSIRNKEKLVYPKFVDFKSPQYLYMDQERAIQVTEIEPGLVRVSTQKPVPPIGMILVCKGSAGSNRLANAFHINKSSSVELNDVTIFHAGGMGVIAERSRDIKLEKVCVQTNPEGHRMVSTTADATHFVNCKGKITLNDCVFKNMLDDATNVHGAYVIVEDILGPDKLGVRIGHHHQAGFIFAGEGDKIGFVNQKQTTIPQFTATVKSVNFLNGRYYTITFNEDIAEQVTTDFVLENLDWYPEVIISNCTISNNRARGILLSTPKKAIIENNYFSNMMSSILVPVELSWWYESGQAQDLIIRNNKFGDNCYGGNKQPVINIHSSLDKTDYTFGTIIIENNEFDHFDSAIIHANGVKNLQFINNKIKNSGTFVPLYPELPVLEFNHIGNLKVKSIDYDGELKEKIVIENIEAKDINL